MQCWKAVNLCEKDDNSKSVTTVILLLICHFQHQISFSRQKNPFFSFVLNLGGLQLY